MNHYSHFEHFSSKGGTCSGTLFPCVQESLHTEAGTKGEEREVRKGGCGRKVRT